MRVRRALVSAALLIALTAPATATAAQDVRTGPVAPTATESDDGLRRVDLLGAPDGSSGGSDDRRRAAVVPEVLSRAVPTDGAVVVGLSWTAATERQPSASIRFRTAQGWGDWEPVEMGTDGEESGRQVAAATSEGMIAVGADRVEVRIEGLAEAPLIAADIVLVDEEPAPTDAGLAAAVTPAAGPASGAVPLAATGAGGATAAAVAAAVDYSRAPAFITRAWWGANETIPYADCAVPVYADDLDRFVVHHTAGTNTYSAADSPAILRGIQRYHVEGRGWCDVGYNVLVDKYGQVFEGRRGGLERLVVGVHASGHNTGTVGVSVLGNFVSQAPSEDAINALVHVIGWKSYIHGLDPSGASLKNGVLLNHVIGHRDVASTACPGSIWNRLHEISIRARDVALAYQPAFTQLGVTNGALFRDGGVVAAFVPTRSDVTVTVRAAGGTVVSSTDRGTERGWLVHRWNGRVGDTDAFLEPGTYTVRMDARSAAGKTFSTTATLAVQYPAGMVARSVPGILSVPAGGASRGADLTAANLPTGTTAVAVRVCAGSSASVRLSGGAAVVTVDPSRAPGGCVLAVVQLDAPRLDVSTPGGSPAATVDLVGAFTPAQPVAAFTDVPPGHEFAEDIQWLYGSGITTGNPDGTYGAPAPISRSAMAAFLYRFAGWPSTVPPSRQTFVDVSPGAQFATEIEWLAAEGISTGTSWGLGRYVYLPSDPVSRQAMAAFLYRICGEPTVRDDSPFPDVAVGGPFTDAIVWLADTGVTTGYSDGTFRPRDPVSRQAMAAFLHRFAEARADGSASCA